LDVPYADKLAQRFKDKLGIKDDEQDQNQVIPPEVKQTLDAMSQQHDLMTQQLNAANEEIRTNQSLKKMELDSAERLKQMDIDGKYKLELLKVETSRDIAEIDAKVQDSLQRDKLDADLNAKLLVQNDAQAHEVAMKAAEVGHDAAMADKSHGQQQVMSEQSHGHAKDMAETQAKLAPKKPPQNSK
jgi:hypothetical protein